MSFTIFVDMVMPLVRFCLLWFLYDLVLFENVAQSQLCLVKTRGGQSVKKTWLQHIWNSIPRRQINRWGITFF